MATSDELTFNRNHGGNVELLEEGRSAENMCVYGEDEQDRVLLSRTPLPPAHVWTLAVSQSPKPYRFPDQPVSLGLAGGDPTTSRLPERIFDLPETRVLGWGSDLYRCGHTVMKECPEMTVGPGDTCGVSWAPGRVTFYRNGCVHYVWEVDTPDTPHIWGAVEIEYLEKLTVVRTALRVKRLERGCMECVHKIITSSGVSIDDDLIPLPKGVLQEIKKYGVT